MAILDKKTCDKLLSSERVAEMGVTGGGGEAVQLQYEI